MVSLFKDIGSEHKDFYQAPEVVHIITGLNNGGAEGTLYRLCTHSESPKSLVISLSGEGLYARKLHEMGVEVVCLNMQKKLFNILIGFLRLLIILIRSKPRVVQTWMYHADLLGGIAARLVGIKRVYWGIRSTFLPAFGTSRIVAQICAKLSKFVPHMIVCCAESALKEHVRLGYECNRMCVIDNGFEFSNLCPDIGLRNSFRKKIEIGPGELVLGLVARFNSQKDHANLFHALQYLKKQDVAPTLILVGPGMEPDNLELLELIAYYELELRIELLGPQDDIALIMNGIDLHVMSSRSEGFPNVLVEAMACGCPCVSTDVGAAAYILDNTGWLVPPEDPEALGDAIKQALHQIYTENWPRRCNLVQESVRDRFNIEKMVTNYRNVWQL